MGQERADADHFRTELFNEPDILDDMFYCLPRAADHNSGSRLIADVFQIR